MTDIDNDQLRRLDGGLLLVFRELVRTRQASATAERLGLSQSAISHALNRLRDLFQDQLFVRRPHGFEPTRRALELAPQVEALIQLAGEAIGGGAEFDPASSRRRFDFSAPEFVAALIGAELIGRLAAAAPSVTFAIGHAAEDQALRGLQRGELDFALGRFGAARPGYVREVLWEDRYCVVARQGHPAIDGAIGLEQWRTLGHVFAWSASEMAGDPAESAPDVAFRAAVPQWLTALLLVAGTDAIGTCPRRLADRHAERLGLQVLAPPFRSDVITVSVLRRAGVRDPGVDWLLDQVRAAAA